MCPRGSRRSSGKDLTLVGQGADPVGLRNVVRDEIVIELTDVSREERGHCAPASAFTRATARVSDRFRRRMSPHRSPTLSIRAAMLRSVNVFGETSPRSICSHVQGADTGAPGLGRTAYAAACVAL